MSLSSTLLLSLTLLSQRYSCQRYSLLLSPIIIILSSSTNHPPSKPNLNTNLQSHPWNATPIPPKANPSLGEIRAETLQAYLDTHRPHFQRVVGFRPTGWTYTPPSSRFTESPTISTIIHHWKTPFTHQQLKPQRGSTSTAVCFGAPYSEHSVGFESLEVAVILLMIVGIGFHLLCSVHLFLSVSWFLHSLDSLCPLGSHLEPSELLSLIPV